jgi:ABC-type uncharacterized transport system substrate-binding protein
MLGRLVLLWLPAVGIVLASALATRAQPERVVRVGYLPSAAPAPGTAGPTLEALRQRLAELSHVEGRNLVIDTRSTEGSLERLPALAAELVGANVDVLVTLGGVATRAAKNATSAIPVVFAVVVDPVAAGLVADGDRPGGNLTGFTSFDPQGVRPHLAVLKEAVPGLSRVAFLGDAAVAGDAARAWDEQQAASAGLQALSLRIRAPDELERAFEAVRREGAQAVLVLETPATVQHRRRIAETAIRHRLPALFVGAYEDAGGTLSYGTSPRETGRRLADYVDAILGGSPPATLPVERLVRFELVVNLRAARAIGLTIPPAVVRRADRVIE